MKNPTSKGIAFSASAVISIAFILLLLFLRLYNLNNIFIILLLLILTFAISYYTFHYFLEKFIYRKIKVIYKNISTRKKQKVPLNESPARSIDIFENIEGQVEEWAKDKNEEISKLRQLEKYRREFLSNVSHELKTPLFNIQGFVHTLIDGGIDDPDVNQYYLKKTADSIDRLTTIVQDLDSISSFEAGKVTLDFSTFDTYLLTVDVFDSLEMLAKEKQIKFSFKPGCENSFYVSADKDRVRQVLVNLIVNSIKYGKDGGETIVGFYDMEPDVLIEITDNGPGIEAENLPRLFERFFRVDKSRTRSGPTGGSGLGLAIVKHILEAHNQSIHVRSTPGAGTTFGFTLARAQEK